MWTALAALLGLATRAESAITLEIRIDATVRTDVAAHVRVKNVGDEPAEDVRPEATLLGAGARADEPKSLPAGFEVGWDLTLPRPRALGTFPLIVSLRYADSLGHRMSAVAVHEVRTAGTPAPAVALELDAGALAQRAAAAAHIRNQEPAAISGTLVLITGEELAVTPTERAIDVAPGGTLTVPIELANRSALPGSTAALWGYLTLPRGSWVDTVTASVAVSIVPPPASDEARGMPAWPFLLVATLAAAAWAMRRWMRPAGPPGPRAARRRTR